MIYDPVLPHCVLRKRASNIIHTHLKTFESHMERFPPIFFEHNILMICEDFSSHPMGGSKNPFRPEGGPCNSRNLDFFVLLYLLRCTIAQVQHCAVCIQYNLCGRF